MAVFPDRIVLKNSTDSSSSIVSQISTGGTDPILPGEIVVGRSNGIIQLYSLDSSGIVRKIGNLSGSSIDELGDVNTTTNIPFNGQALVWDGTNWIPGNVASDTGRGDGGDFDVTEIFSSFTFGVWGGGDFDTTTDDRPIELLSPEFVDGCEIISDFTAVEQASSSYISLASQSCNILIGYTATIDSEVNIAVSLLEPQQIGVRAWVQVSNTEIMITKFNPNVQTGSGGPNFFASFVAQTYGQSGDLYPGWWSD